MNYRKGMRRLALLLVPVVAAGCGPDSTGGACKDKLVAGDLVITEVFADFAAPAGGTGTDDGKEWFEIYNNADRPVSLKGMTIVPLKMYFHHGFAKVLIGLAEGRSRADKRDRIAKRDADRDIARAMSRKR